MTIYRGKIVSLVILLEAQRDQEEIHENEQHFHWTTWLKAIRAAYVQVAFSLKARKSMKAAIMPFILLVHVFPEALTLCW